MMDHEKIKEGVRLMLEGIGEDVNREGTVEVYARRPQIQENMTAQIADALEEHLQPKGVMVMIEAEHMCMTMRGVQKPGSKTVTTIVRGAFAEDFSLQQTFLQMVKA